MRLEITKLMTQINIKKASEREAIRNKIYDLLSRAILQIMKEFRDKVETKTNKTFMTNITRVRGVDPGIGKEKKKTQASQLIKFFTPDRRSESSANLEDIGKDINDDNIS